MRLRVIGKEGDRPIEAIGRCVCDPAHPLRWEVARTATAASGAATIAELAPCTADGAEPALKEMSLDWLASTAMREAEHQIDESHRRLQQMHEYQFEVGAAKYMAEDLERMARSQSGAFAAQAKMVHSQISIAFMSMYNYTRGRFLPPTLVFRRTSIETLLERAEHLCTAIGQIRGIRIEVEIEDATIDLAAEHMQHALNNVLHNAVKYSYDSRATREGKVTHRYVTLRAQPRGDRYYILVTNYGVGILKDEYPLIFREGYRGRLTPTEYRTGAGMGLYLTRRIVQLHGGSIRVLSEPTGDPEKDPYHTAFTIQLPLTQPKRPEVPFVA